MTQPKKRLVVCLDGTWNTPDSGNQPTNVVKIMRALSNSENTAKKRDSETGDAAISSASVPGRVSPLSAFKLSAPRSTRATTPRRGASSFR